MMQAAVPDYLGHNFDDAPPGHKFGLYFSIWNPKSWAMEDRSKTVALKKTLSVPVASREQIAAIRSRQFALVSLTPENTRLTLEALSTSPLVTGMGMEHPLENGFAFLNPYGLPYLPGSSIKGVLRQAARELEWDKTLVDALFGGDVAPGNTDTQRTRGALIFWDAIPELAGNTLGMDVMTPHYGDYYQGTGTPHDAGSPNPIVFMVIPPGAQFSFHITANPGRLKGLSDWQAQIREAFEYTFKWLGFGAKTSVGYGAMTRDKSAEEANAQKMAILAEEAEKQRLELEKKAALQAELSVLSPLAAEFRLQSSAGKWEENKDAFVAMGVIEGWLDKLEAEQDDTVITMLTSLIEQHFSKTLLDNPEATKGKKGKEKPVFKPRQQQIGKRLNALRA